MRQTVLPIMAIIRKEMTVFFRYYYTEVTFTILFPILMVLSMDLGPLGNEIEENKIAGHNLIDFLIPGLLMMSVIQTSTMNTGFIIYAEKNYVNAFEALLLSPVTPKQIAAAKIISGATKATINGGVSGLVLVLYRGLPLGPATILLIPLMFSVGLFFSSVGVLLGNWVKKGYHLSSLGNLITFPMTFFGGVFFDIDSLGGFVGELARLSPWRFMIDGARVVMLESSWNIIIPMLVIWALNIPMIIFMLWAFDRKAVD